jgi:DMSO/TMAO reductase YedYZ molybdopterin-dependent catalytic subunit
MTAESDIQPVNRADPWLKRLARVSAWVLLAEVVLLVIGAGSPWGDRMKNKLVIILALSALALVAAASCGSPPSEIPPGEVEAAEYMGVKLTPIEDQRNNALAGTQHIDRDSYRLTVDGLVERPLSLTYDDLTEYEQISKLMDLNCVEGWDFTAKWTGPALTSIFDDAGVKPEASIAIFHTADVSGGYTSLDLSYIRDNNIIIALKLNDITLPPERGFPFQVVAESKFGYKWAKWVDRIELSDDTAFLGYWEGYGYSNSADIHGPAFAD